MTLRSTKRARLLAGVVVSLALVAAACGSDDDTGSDSTEASADVTTAATDAPDATDTTDAPAATEPDATAPDGTVATDEPLGEATGEPIRIGVQNLEGDPNGCVPRVLDRDAGCGRLHQRRTRRPRRGRPIATRASANRSRDPPDDSQRCANELAADEIELAVSTINFFGNHFADLPGLRHPGARRHADHDRRLHSEGVYAIGAGGGCLGVHTGLVQFATDEIEGLEGIERRRSACRGRTRLPAPSATTTSKSKPTRRPQRHDAR